EPRRHHSWRRRSGRRPRRTHRLLHRSPEAHREGIGIRRQRREDSVENCAECIVSVLEGATILWVRRCLAFLAKGGALEAPPHAVFQRTAVSHPLQKARGWASLGFSRRWAPDFSSAGNKFLIV